MQAIRREGWRRVRSLMHAVIVDIELRMGVLCDSWLGQHSSTQKHNSL
jgi:hypothetical protein